MRAAAVLLLALAARPAAAALRWGAVEAFRERVEEASPETPSGAPPPSPEEAFLHHPAPWRLPGADVLQVVDGDTAIVRLGGIQEKVRFAGINAPETAEPCGSSATLRARELAGGRVLLALPEDGRDRDEYGRLLRHPYAPDGRSLEAVLVREGSAFAWRDGTLSSTVLTGLEGEARAAGAGCLWGGP